MGGLIFACFLGVAALVLLTIAILTSADDATARAERWRRINGP